MQYNKNKAHLELLQNATREGAEPTSLKRALESCGVTIQALLVLKLDLDLISTYQSISAKNHFP